MNTKAKQITIVATVIPLLLIADQCLKFWVKTHMQIGEDIPICSWFHIHFVENQGMAFGLSFGENIGKLLLSLFRIVASGILVWFIVNGIRKGISTIYVVCLSLILVGAVGNLVDSCFYGLIFNESYFSVAQIFPPEGGYAPFLYGRVVDMFYFPLFTIDLPWGGQYLFFDAIFNIADAAITVGTILFIIVYFIRRPQKTLTSLVKDKKTPTDSEEK
jgi:signal peptidase II